MQKDISEKPSVMTVEDIGNDDDLQKPQVKKDYSGVAEKTDPAEIALVKKLDRWIMPMLWSMYWLNYLDRNAIALARLNDLEEDLNLTGTRMPHLHLSTIDAVLITSRIPYLRFHSLRRLPPWTE